MKFVKANWRLIVGVLFVISAVSSLVVLDFVGVIVCGAIGGGLIFWQYKDANRDKPAEHESPIPIRANLRFAVLLSTTTTEPVGKTFSRKSIAKSRRLITASMSN